MADSIRMTRTTREVLGVLLDALGGDPKPHGLEICRQTRLGTGTVYPILARLERAGWVSAEWEPEHEWLPPAGGDKPRRQPRPRRRLYELTGSGRAAAAEALREPGGRPHFTVRTPKPTGAG